MHRIRAVSSRIACLFACACFALLVYSPGGAFTTSSATLASGETTPDGKLTLLVVKSLNGDLRVSLKNNNYRAVVVDTYVLSRGPSFNCSGRNLRIASSATQTICTVPNPANQSPAVQTVLNTPDPNAGRASLQMSLTWHELPRPVPSPSPSPSVTASPTPMP